MPPASQSVSAQLLLCGTKNLTFDFLHFSKTYYVPLIHCDPEDKHQ